MRQDPGSPLARTGREAAVVPEGRGSGPGISPRESGSPPASAAVGVASLVPPVQRTSKRRPQARLRAVGGEAHAVADWASLFGDLARRTSLVPEVDPPVEWRVHDRMHVEFAIDYPLAKQPSAHTWEAYFFVPESFRLHEGTYDKKDIYEDLWSYVRYAVPTIPFYQLASLVEGSHLSLARAALEACVGKPATSAEAAEATRRLRLFACLVRASGLAAMREVERKCPVDGTIGASFVATCNAVAGAFRKVMDEVLLKPVPDDVATAAHWADEDISLVLETFSASLGVSLEARSQDGAALGEVAEQLAAHAVSEARHRRDRGYDSVGSSAADERLTEHFEFRRHMLKRFTASVLWLSLEVRQAATWIVHALYALAAAAAMAFALAASVGTAGTSASFLRYALPIVVAYAVKDRMKAMLQSAFSGLVAKRFPDRKWSIRDRERDRRVGDVHERAGFLPFRSLPEEVLAMRRLTRAHALEEQARPERVLWHQKTINVAAREGAGDAKSSGADFPMLTEIFRLNLRRWLSHTDDPNRKIVFADPEDALVYQVTTRRVYNINVVYRLCEEGAEGAWHRLRVVVSRKGIERIEPIC